jgi:two-component system chemotaxis response regulator CheY
MRALIVDDSRAMRAILRTSLPRTFEVHEAGHGAEALERLATLGVVDLALVDWNMPVMNGLEFVQVIRQRRGFDSMKILMVTTETESEQIIAAVTAGADEYLMKPFTREALAEKVALLGLAGET